MTFWLSSTCRSFVMWVVVATIPWTVGQVIAAAASPQELPDYERWPQEAEAWSALQSERAAGAPYSEENEQFAALHTRMGELADTYVRSGAVIDAAMASSLLDELYVDYGDPTLNSASQDYIVGAVMLELTKLPESRVSPAVRRQLAQGLIRYAEAGGGWWTPAARGRLANVMDYYARGDEAVVSRAQTVLGEALQWAQKVGDETQIRSVTRTGKRLWGDQFAMRAHEARLAAEDALPEDLPERYRRAVRALYELLDTTSDDDTVLARRLHEATQATEAPLRDNRLEADLTTRLLIAYRCLLERKSPTLKGRPASYIEERLIRMSRKRGTLKSAEHWRLWGDALVKLGSVRMSEQTKRWLRTMRERPNLPVTQAEVLRSLEPICSTPHRR